MTVSATDSYTSEDLNKILADIKDSLPAGASLRPLLMTHGAKLVAEIDRLRADNEDLRKERDAYQSDAAALMKRVSELESDDRPEGAEPCTDCGGHGYTL